MFKQATKHSMDYLIITCVPDNIASSRTCEIVGESFWKLRLSWKIMKCMHKVKDKLKSLSSTFKKFLIE